MVSPITGARSRSSLRCSTCELVLVNKVDLLPHLDFDLDKFLYNLDAVHPGQLVETRRRATASRSGDWLVKLASPVREMV